MGFCDFNIVAENLVEPYLQRVDAGAFSFLLFQAGDPRFPLADDLPEPIQLAVIAVFDDSTLFDRWRCVVPDTLLNDASHILKVVQGSKDLTKQRCLKGLKNPLDVWKPVDRCLQSDKIPSIGPCRSDTCIQPFQIVDLFEGLSNLQALHFLLDQLLDSIQAALDLPQIHKGIAQPVFECSGAHRSDSNIENTQKGSPDLPFKQTLRQFEISSGRLIHNHIVTDLEIVNGFEMGES